MKIALRKPHTKTICGANGLISEIEATWELIDRLKPVLELYGHEVLIIRGDDKIKNDYLQTKKGCEEANKFNADIYLSFHMNAFNKIARGCEYIVYDDGINNLTKICDDIMEFMCSIGVPFRRKIINSSFWELKETTMEASIIELLFCDNEYDVNIWNSISWEKLVWGICHAIDKNIPYEKPIQENTFYRVVTGSFVKRENAEERIKELSEKGFNSFLDIYKK